MKKPKMRGEMGNALKTLFAEISPEELETGILKPNRQNSGKTWTPEEIAQTISAELQTHSLGKLLAQARAERNQSLGQVGAKIGVTRGRVHQREQPSANLEIRSFVEQAQALGFDVIVTLKPKGEGRVLQAELR